MPSDDQYTLMVDIDGTLCPKKRPDESYADLIPYPNMVTRLQMLHAAGARITLYTSRNMRTYQGDLSQINKHTARVLLDWLDRWNIPYDGILYGKPWPGKHGFYVDDRSIRPDEFLKLNLSQLEALCHQSREAIIAHPEKMTVIITMAGFGSRFRNAGYTQPKYQIQVKGKSLFAWSMESLQAYKPFVEKYIFVVRKADHAQNFIRKNCAEMGIEKLEIIELDAPTDGQATTCRLAMPYCHAESPIFIYNIDTYVEAGTMKIDTIRGDGFIPCFTATGDHWSFVRVNENGQATEVREKQRISDYCSIGAYYFSSAKLYMSLYDAFYADDRHIEKNEKYIAPMYNQLIAMGKDVFIENLPANKVHVLGTPEEVDAFKNLHA